MNRQEQIASILSHYFRVAWNQAGANWQAENQEEIEELARVIADEPMLLAHDTTRRGVHKIMRYFFVFSYGDPHLAHVVRGEEKHTLELVRTLIRSGAQVKHLHYISAVVEGTHHEREKIAASHIPECGHEPPQASKEDDTTLFPEGMRVEGVPY